MIRSSARIGLAVALVGLGLLAEPSPASAVTCDGTLQKLKTPSPGVYTELLDVSASSSSDVWTVGTRIRKDFESSSVGVRAFGDDRQAAKARAAEAGLQAARRTRQAKANDNGRAQRMATPPEKGNKKRGTHLLRVPRLCSPELRPSPSHTGGTITNQH